MTCVVRAACSTQQPLRGACGRRCGTGASRSSGGAAAGAQVFNLREAAAEVADAKKRSMLLGVAGVSQLGLAVLMKMYCFSYRRAAPLACAPAAQPAVHCWVQVHAG